MARIVHLKGHSRLARGEVRVKVDRVAGLVEFRPFRRRRSYSLPLDVWVGIGFDHAVKVMAYAERMEKQAKRKAAKG